MEPITLLIYTAIVFLVVIGTLLSLVLFRIFRILSRVDHIMGYIDHIRELLEMWERLPFELLKKVFDRFLGK